MIMFGKSASFLVPILVEFTYRSTVSQFVYVVTVTDPAWFQLSVYSGEDHVIVCVKSPIPMCTTGASVHWLC